MLRGTDDIGLHRRGGRLFVPGDQTYRVIPSETPAADIIQSHTSIGFDRVAIIWDLNISFPIDRVRELVARANWAGSGHPATRSWARCATSRASRPRRTGPEVARRLREEGTDVALITST